MARPAAPATSVAVGGDTVGGRLAQLEQAISRKADQTTEPVYRAVQLIAPGGAVWRLSVADDGTISTELVERV